MTDQLGSGGQRRRAAAEREEDEMRLTMVRQKVKDGSVGAAAAGSHPVFELRAGPG
jgi:hypothetical protein